MKNYSRQREAIVRTLSATDSHPTAEEIRDEVKKTCPNVSLATVYRNLRMLSSEEDILVLHTGDGKEHYDANVFPHAHLYCSGCGRVYDVMLDVNQIASLRSIRPMADFELNYYGVCEGCARGNEN